jgi:uracil-DNA glycosylase
MGTRGDRLAGELTDDRRPHARPATGTAIAVPCHAGATRIAHPMADSIEDLKQRARSCRACPLWTHATQTVFGAGDPHAKVMLVGEQPGDEEDLKGLPFVGPAGRLLDRALEAAQVDRRLLYVTNAVKHFKWQPRGKRRLHKTPAQREIDACYPWLAREIEAIRPRVVVALGATAARALLGAGFRVSTMRGRFIDSPLAPSVFATLHPSALLRLRGESERVEAFRRLVSDLALIHVALDR